MTTIRKSSLLAQHLPDFVLLLYVIAVTAGAFTGGLWAGLGLGCAAILFGCVWGLEKKIPLPPTDLSFMALVFFVVVAILNLSSSQPDISWQEWAKLLTIFVPLLLFFNPSIATYAGHKSFFAVLPVAIIIGGVALSIQLYLKAKSLAPERIALELAHYNRGFSYLMLLSFPVMAGLWFSKKRWLIVPFFLFLLVPASLTESRSSKLALILGLAAIFCAYFVPVLVRWLLMAGTVVTIGWPFAAQEFFLKHYDTLARIPGSWRARIEIWDYMSYRIWEHPFFGWGLGTSHTLPFQEPHGAQYIFTIVPAAHPHNVMTLLWVELGLPGLALGFAFAFLTLRKAGRLDPRLVPFALGAWTACFCLSLIAYDFWTDSLFAAFALTAFAFVILERQLKPQSSKAVPGVPR